MRQGLAILALVAAGALPSPPRRHVVEMRGMAFHPAVLEVAPGDTVVWVNRDIVPHTATAAARPGWTTGNLTQGQSGRHIARRTGEAPYICELHPTMQGKLVIR